MSSAVSRIISGSISSWVRIGISILSQMLLVPLYLAHWDVRTYGVWLAIQALVSVLSTLDTGHQNFLAYEFLRFGKLRILEIRKVLWSGVVVGILLGILQLIFIVGTIVLGILPRLMGKAHQIPNDLINTAGIVLFLQGVSWLICGSVGGLLVRALAPFGYYPRMSWWGVFAALITSAAPAIAVTYGANLLITGVVAAGATILYNLPMYVDIFRLLYKEQLYFIMPNLKLAFKNFFLSLALSGKSLLETIRQQGVRLILAPLSGVSALAAFSTMRTGANVALQGLNTLVNPLEPELMRFLHQRDQERSEAAFGTVWIVLIAIMAPGVVLLQTFIAPLYQLWTMGRIPFNGNLFALLSLGVLVYSLAQPAVAVVIGNNLLKPQLYLSALSAFAVVAGMWVLVPLIGILGAGISLLIAEILATGGYVIVARKWLKENGLQWPRRSSQIATFSVLLSAIFMLATNLLPNQKWIVLVVAMIALYWNLVRYWKALPLLATQRAVKMLVSLPFIRKFIKL